MDDLISRQAAIDAMRECDIELPIYSPREVDIFWNDAIDACCEAVETLPPADTDLSAYSDKLWRAAYERGRKETERKKGRWLGSENRDEFMECSNCHHEEEWYSVGGYYQADEFNFCPRCGADMRGEQDEDR